MANGVKFIKQYTIGKGKDGNDRFTQQFVIDGTNFDTQAQVPSSFGVPLTGLTSGVAWYFSNVTARNNQGNVDFGPVKSLQISISKQQAQSNAAGTAYVIPGRVLIFIPASGQVFFFPTKLGISSPWTLIAGAPTLWEHYNDIVPVVIPDGGNVQIWMEPDILNGAAVAPSTEINLLLCNFSLPPIGKVGVTD